MKPSNKDLKSCINSNLANFSKKVALHKLIEPAKFELLKTNPNAFLFGLLADQSVKAEKAWSLPFNLQERIGNLDIPTILDLEEDKVIEHVKTKPALHQYPSPIAKYIFCAAEKLNADYENNAALIWEKDYDAKNIIERLKEFKGISCKKANLGTLILIRDFNVPITNRTEINIACDIHIRRTFGRIGLVQLTGKIKRDNREAKRVAKEIRPDFPGELTSFFWHLGRTWCFASEPDCSTCPCNSFCEKNI